MARLPALLLAQSSVAPSARPWEPPSEAWPEPQLDTRSLKRRDPTGAPGTQPVATGVGTAGGAATGAVVGAALGGPVGAVAGAAVGGLAGAAAGHKAGEAVNPTPKTL